jgi:anti-anti-sigma factor
VSSFELVQEDVMSPQQRLMGIEHLDDTAVVTVLSDLREFEFQEIEREASYVLELLDRKEVKNVVLDFQKTDFYGSTALGFFVKLWKRVSSLTGQMVFCGLSPHEREILRTTKLDGLWLVCETKEEALQAVGDMGKR